MYSSPELRESYAFQSTASTSSEALKDHVKTDYNADDPNSYWSMLQVSIEGMQVERVTCLNQVIITSDAKKIVQKLMPSMKAEYIDRRKMGDDWKRFAFAPS